MNRFQFRALTTISGGLLLAGLMWAQPPGGGRARGLAAGDGSGPRGGAGRLVHFLELTEEQKEQWQAAHEEHTDASRAIHQQLRDNRMQLEEIIDDASPDPTAVGELFLEGRELQSQLRDGREQLKLELKSFLTDEQIERWEAFEAARGDRGPRRWRQPRHRRGLLGSGAGGL